MGISAYPIFRHTLVATVSSAAQLAQGYYGGNEVIDKVQGLAQPTQSSEHPRVGYTHTQQGFSKLNSSQSVGIKHGNGQILKLSM